MLSLKAYFQNAPYHAQRQPIILKIKQVKAKESQKFVWLDLIVDYRLTFKDHVDMLCSTVNYELDALWKIRKYLTLEKAKLLCNAFVNNQFNL